jgi:hypothetical protein
MHFESLAPDEPHARVNLEVIHLAKPGPRVRDKIVLNGGAIPTGSTTSVETGAVTSVRVPIGAIARCQLSTNFYHDETRSETESVPTYRQEIEYDSCATHEYEGHCKGGTRLVSKRGSELRSVTRQVEVSDGQCEQSAFYRFERDETYTLQFTFISAGECVLTCTRQQRGPSDSARSEPCKPIPLEVVEEELQRDRDQQQKRERRWEIGSRVAYGVPAGDEFEDSEMAEIIEGQTSLEFDAAYRLTPNWALGVDLQYGFGASRPQVRESCPWGSSKCNIASASFGLQLNYRARPGRSLDPWIGIGTGIDSLVLKEVNSDNQRSLRGWEMFKAQLGLDIALSRSLVAGPFGALSMGQYTDTNCRAQGCDAGDANRKLAFHQWFFIGVRGAFVL